LDKDKTWMYLVSPHTRCMAEDN